MAMTIKTDGLESLTRMLTQLGNKAQDVASGALFDGAGVVADAFSSAVNGIQTKPKRFYAVEGSFQRMPTEAEKNALIGKTGIARFKKDSDTVDTLIGFTGAGYADVDGKRKPVAEIARSINSGTSFMKKQPFARQATNRSQAAAKEAMVAKAEKMLKEIINE